MSHQFIRMLNTGMAVLGLVCLPELGAQTQGGDAAGDRERRIGQLEEQVQILMQEIQELKRQPSARLPEAEVAELKSTADKLQHVSSERLFDPDSWINRFTLGGYGEIHANFGAGDTNEQLDLHRLVLYLGYEFNDWIHFHSELELEHALVSKSSGGYVLFEQAYVDFLFSPEFNIRAGRVLTPLGIINQYHEPPLFYGIERPTFAKYIIPTTWSSDGVGIFGRLSPQLTYEFYVTNGLDGTGFDDVNGIRGGRLHERPSLNDVAVSGRVDIEPQVAQEYAWADYLRIGLSAYHGGINNGNQGKDPGISGDITILSADFQWALADFRLRGVAAWETIDGAGNLAGGIAEEIYGWYLEGAYHWWPEQWKKGKLKNSDAAVFARYEKLDTQAKMPSSVAKNPAGERQEITLGINFYPTSSFVIKTDYQIRQDKSDETPNNLWNLGVGWVF